MRHYLCIAYVAAGVLLSACSDIGVSRDEPVVNDPPAGVQIVDGHLHFDSQESFEGYIACFLDDSGCPSPEVHAVPGFTSLAQMSEEIQTRSVSDEMEISLDEYRVYLAQEILTDPVLSYVVDTTLTVSVDDKLYKITDKCTIVASKELGVDFVNELAGKLNPLLFDLAGDMEEVVVNDDVKFINTSRNAEADEDLFVEILDEGAETRAPVAPGVRYHSAYNVKSYGWKNQSVFQKLLDSVKGKEVSRTHEIDGKHRVMVSIFNVDYGFYKSSGITVKLQKMKKFLGIPIWTAMKADDIVVGFNHMAGEYNLVAPQSYSMFSDKGFGNFSKFDMTIDKELSPMLAGCISNVPFIKNWTEKMALCFPKVFLDMVKMDYLDLANAMYVGSAAGICAGMKAGLKQAYDVEKKEMTDLANASPRMALMVWGKTNSKFSKERPLFMGVQDYGAVNRKTVRFDFSAGIHLSFTGGGFGFKPMAISEFLIDDLDAFASAKYKGKWYGVRFTGTKEIW